MTRQTIGAIAVEPFFVRGGLADTTMRFARSMTDHATRAYRVRRTERILQKLDDHVLNDIGIERYDIPRIARLAADMPGTDFRSFLKP